MPLGYKHTPETRAKMSASRRAHVEKMRANLPFVLTGVRHHRLRADHLQWLKDVETWFNTHPGLTYEWSARWWGWRDSYGNLFRLWPTGKGDPDWHHTTYVFAGNSMKHLALLFKLTFA